MNNILQPTFWVRNHNAVWQIRGKTTWKEKVTDGEVNFKPLVIRNTDDN